MNNLLKQLLLGGSATALVAGASFTAALAQENNSGALDIETVNSSASRIDLKGFEAPTPVTVIGVDTLNRDAKVQIGDEIRELPQIRGGNSITTGSFSGNLAQVNAGVDTVSIRGLGAQRNLVLFDHQRVVSSTVQDGYVDLSLIPSGVTQRVDVVTGGASAAWGSDAVTGVVNIVINKTFEGFKGSVTYSNSTEVSKPVYRASMAWGTAFLGGKGHTVLAADWTMDSDPLFAGEQWQAHQPNGRAFVYNPAYCSNIVYPGGGSSGGSCASVNPGQPLQIYAYGTGQTRYVQGGLVNGNSGGVAGAPIAANALKGTMFVGNEDTPTLFNYGTLYNSGNNCYNGCTNNQYDTGGWSSNNPYHSATYFSYTSYQLTPDIKASLQLNYARLSLRSYGNSVGGTNRRIYADNAYLPDSIAQQFVCAGGTPGGAGCSSTLSNGYNPYTHQYDLIAGQTVKNRQDHPAQYLTMGFEFTGNHPNPSPSALTDHRAVKYSMEDFCLSVRQNCGFYNKTLTRGVFTLEGTLSDDWVWNAYLEASQARVVEEIQQVISNRVTNALDAVRVTSGNVGTSGLPIGSIQCRGLLDSTEGTRPPSALGALGITQASEMVGCVPYDAFGTGEASSALLNYVKPSLNYQVAEATGNQTNGELDRLLVRMNQVEGAATMQGVLPWQLPAGEVGVSFGAEWRLDQSGQYLFDPRAIGSYPSGNFNGNLAAHLHSEEGFLEVAAPLLKNTFVQSLDLDVAGRLTNYSFSGLVETWKLGVTSQVNDDFKLRFTWSYDIRAPDNWDLYGPGSLGQISCPSFVIGPTGSNGGAPNSCFNVEGGNPNLQPEKAETLTAGIVLTPHWLDGVTASVDWYQIHLHGALYKPGSGLVLSRCQSGEEVYCGNLVFDRQGSYGAALGCGNLGSNDLACKGGDTTSQIDFVRIGPVNAALLTTAGFDFAVAYGFDLFTGSMDVSFNGNYVYDYSQTLNGVYFQGAGGGGYYGGGAKFQGTLNANYREGPWSYGVQLHLNGDSLMDLGTEGQPAISCADVTFSRQTVNGVVQDVPDMTPGQRCSAETNYNAMTAVTDLRVQYRWNNNITLFAAVDNVQDLPRGTSSLRRSYRFGVRWNY
jgi:outer membrane receptor protein involved in Fe transport